MDILKALKHEERKIEMSVKHGMKHLEAIRASIKVFAGGLVGNGKLGKRGRISADGRASIARAQRARWPKIRSAKPTRRLHQRSKMSAATRAKMAKAQRARWTKVREARINVA
jgi:hypothetical protein